MHDDTGSDNPLIFRDDIESLIDPLVPYPYYGLPAHVATANGVVIRRTAWFQAEWRHPTTGRSATGKFWEMFVIDDTKRSYQVGAVRLSGMSMRARLFTATSPYNNGALVVADSRSGAYKKVGEGVNH
ncbi:hypothetical protein BJ508DRAFT_335042 [Ascobolus immersus RN42]|uniref:Uncharacterized protein n=1 Tax=Ascobolus immersus RN42 TaxID=1160509 RepID=A0A3N4HDX8_ASCIM|nr:hypothetical protein BJ508DRAFT_335042 [Ascobolus immersus RN42]